VLSPIRAEQTQFSLSQKSISFARGQTAAPHASPCALQGFSASAIYALTVGGVRVNATKANSITSSLARALSWRRILFTRQIPVLLCLSLFVFFSSAARHSVPTLPAFWKKFLLLLASQIFLLREWIKKSLVQNETCRFHKNQ
jgi:hypothetical protein